MLGLCKKKVSNLFWTVIFVGLSVLSGCSDSEAPGKELSDAEIVNALNTHLPDAVYSRDALLSLMEENRYMIVADGAHFETVIAEPQCEGGRAFIFFNNAAMVEAAAKGGVYKFRMDWPLVEKVSVLSGSELLAGLTSSSRKDPEYIRLFLLEIESLIANSSLSNGDAKTIVLDNRNVIPASEQPVFGEIVSFCADAEEGFVDGVGYDNYLEYSIPKNSTGKCRVIVLTYASYSSAWGLSTGVYDGQPRSQNLVILQMAD